MHYNRKLSYDHSRLVVKAAWDALPISLLEKPIDSSKYVIKQLLMRKGYYSLLN